MKNASSRAWRSSESPASLASQLNTAFPKATPLNSRAKTVAPLPKVTPYNDQHALGTNSIGRAYRARAIAWTINRILMVLPFRRLPPRRLTQMGASSADVLKTLLDLTRESRHMLLLLSRPTGWDITMQRRPTRPSSAPLWWPHETNLHPNRSKPATKGNYQERSAARSGYASCSGIPLLFDLHQQIRYSTPGVAIAIHTP
jgi:hypothetical protein